MKPINSQVVRLLQEIKDLSRKLDIVRRAGESGRINQQVIQELEAQINSRTELLNRMNQQALAAEEAAAEGGAEAGAEGTAEATAETTAEGAAEAPVQTTAEGGASAGAETGWGALLRRLAPGLLVAVLLAVAVMGYRLWQAHHADDDIRNRDLSGPANLGPGGAGGGAGTSSTKTSTVGPLAGDVTASLAPSGTAGKPPVAPVSNKPPTRKKIELPAGIGEDANISLGNVKMVSGGQVSLQMQQAVIAWDARIDSRMKQAYREGKLGDLTDTWNNTVIWGNNVPAVARAELTQTGNAVTGSLCVTVASDPGNFRVRKVRITRGIVTGSPGGETLTLEAEGDLRGILKRIYDGTTLSGELNGSLVEVFDTKSGILRAQFEAADPSPLKPAGKK